MSYTFLCILQGPTLTSLPLGSPPGFPYYSKNEWLLPPPQLPRIMDPWALATLGPFFPIGGQALACEGPFLFISVALIPMAAPSTHRQRPIQDGVRRWLRDHVRLPGPGVIPAVALLAGA